MPVTLLKDADGVSHLLKLLQHQRTSEPSWMQVLFTTHRWADEWLTQVAGLAVETVELLLIGPLLVVGGGDDEQPASPAEPAITEHFKWCSLYTNIIPDYYCQEGDNPKLEAITCQISALGPEAEDPVAMSTERLFDCVVWTWKHETAMTQRWGAAGVLLKFLPVTFPHL